MKISEHLDLSEFIKSNTASAKGIDNSPTPEHLENAKKLAVNIFEPIRVHFDKPIFLSSGYRSKALNAATPGSSSTSDHCFGRAMDLQQKGHGTGVEDNQVFHFIKDNLKFKQLIAEYPENGIVRWVHVAYDENNLKNEILICIKQDGKPKYLPYKGNEKLVK